MSEHQDWPYSPESMSWIEMNRDEWKALAEERAQEIRKLRSLLSEHHAVDAHKGTIVGDRCQVCARVS